MDRDKKIKLNMEKIVCSDRSREILKEYSENNSFAMTLIERQNKIDMLKVLDLLEQMRQNWDYEKLRAEAMEEELNQRNNEKDGMQKEIRIYREQLRDARTQIAVLMSDKKNMQYDIAEWERKFELVNDLLKDQSHLSLEDRKRLLTNSSVLNKKPIIVRETGLGFSRNSSGGESIDYDKTADAFDISPNEMDESRLRSGKVYRRQVTSRSTVSLTTNRISAVASKRPKKSMMVDTVEEEVETPCKRSKDKTEAHIAATMATVNAEINKSPRDKLATRSSLFPASILDKSEEVLTLPTNTLTPRCETNSSDLTPLNNVKTWTHGASISTRPHTYTNHSSILGVHCEVCNGWIGIVGKQAYKCCDCGLHIHKACIDDAPMPCVPRTPTYRTPAKQRPRLKDLCPSTQPMIPPILIHCILALEKNRLCSEGIYRIPGDDSQVQKLLNDFQSGSFIPKLDYHDTETITSCVKQFLNKLRDPVIPSTSWEEFVSAAGKNDIEALNRGIMDLPYPNRDTLAFLCAHFQKICDNCIRNKMPRNVLARCVAAVIVGPAPSHVVKDDEEKKQVMVMSALLKMPSDYWPKFYSFDNGIPLINSLKCTLNDNRKPVRTPYKNPNKSILGPVETPPSGQKTNTYQPKISKRKHFLGDIF